MHEPIFPSEMPQMILRGTDSTKCWKHSHRFRFILAWYRHTIAADLCVANKCGIFHYISNGLRTDDCGVHLGMRCVTLVDNTHLQKMGTMWSWRDGPGFLKKGLCLLTNVCIRIHLYLIIEIHRSRFAVCVKLPCSPTTICEYSSREGHHPSD